MAGRRQARDVDDVLDADRHAVQRTAQPAGLSLGFGGQGSRHRGLAVDPDEGVELGVELLDAVEQRAGEIDGRKLLRRDGAGSRLYRHPVQVAHSVVPAFIGGQGSAADRPGA